MLTLTLVWSVRNRFFHQIWFVVARKRPDHMDPAASFLRAEFVLLSDFLWPIRDVVKYVVQRVAVQRLREPLLVEVVAHQAD